MGTKLIKAAGSSAVIALMALSGATPALAAKSHHKRHHRNGTASSSTTGNGETPLTGSTLTSAENAAITANPGATANSASTETDSSLSGAAYEVHITQSDGSKAVVIENSSFNVLATQAGGGCQGGSGGGNGETPLTGASLTSAENAAITANPGATANSASTETDSSLSGAAYEVHITQSDGSKGVVIEDSSFNVLATQAQQTPNHGGRQR